MESACLFCSIGQNLKKQVLLSHPLFWVVYDGFPVTEPHILIIPKKHTASFSKLAKSQFIQLEKLISRLKPKIGDILIFEHGELGQTVKHAHLHLVPEVVSLDELKEATDLKGQLISLKRLNQIVDFDKYLLFADKNDIFVLKPSGNVEPGIITNTLAKLLSVPYPAVKRKRVDLKLVKKYHLD